MLMIVVLAELGETHAWEALFVKRTMIASAQVTIQAKHQHRFDSDIISPGSLDHIPCYLPGEGITLSTQTTNSVHILLGSGQRRSEEHTSELQSHSFISYAVFC